MKSNLLFLALMLSCSIVKAQCFPDKHIAVPNITDKSYHDARKELLAYQWQPMRTLSIYEDPNDLMGNARIFWEQNYDEVESCSGTGFAPCIFNFSDIYGNHLKVYTSGEEIPEEKTYAGVSSYGFYCDD